MSGEFDPYQQWLGIPSHEQPPDHYRLLGIARFESDNSVIQLAAEKQMAHIRAFQTGPRASYTQQLLNELAAAKIRLLNAATKAQYDAALADAVSLSDSSFSPELLPPSDERAARNESETVATASVPVRRDSSLLDIRVGAGSPAAATETKREPQLWRAWLPWGVAAVSLLAAAAMFVAMRRQAGRHAAGPGTSEAGTATQVEPSRVAKPSAVPAVVVNQESSGDVHLSGKLAAVSGAVELRTVELPAGGSVEGLAGWSSEEDAVQWKFKVARLPSQGVFRARVTYATGSTNGRQRYIILLDGKSRVPDIRASSGHDSAGNDTIDEFFLNVPTTGEHSLAIRTSGETVGFVLKSVDLLFQQMAVRSK